MTKLADHQSNQTTKIMIVGTSGAGKSGCLASLAADGYNLRIIDLDNGTDILKSVLSSPGIYPEGSIDNVDSETVTDSHKNVNGKLIPKATAWQRVTNMISGDTKDSNPWKHYGSIVTWTPTDVLVIDGLTRLTEAARDFNQAPNGRLGQKVNWDDIYATQQTVDTLMETVTDSEVSCQVVIIAHPDHIKGQDGIERGFPKTIGKALSQTIGRHFNNVIEANSGIGANRKRKLMTRGSGLVEVKTSNPGAVKPEYSIETGLAELFRDLKGGWAPTRASAGSK